MPTYITLIRYTDKGISNIKDMPQRVDAAREAFRAVGGDMVGFYLTMGHYDAVSIGEAPDDATMAKALLQLGSLGNVHTETLKAFPEEEAKNLVASLP